MLGFGRARAAEARVQELEAENRNYTDTITNALLDAATGAASAGYVSGLETGRGPIEPRVRRRDDFRRRHARISIPG